MTSRNAFRRLKALGRRRNVLGMARFGIGVKPLRSLAKRIGKNHALALQLWKTGCLEARILAALTERWIAADAIRELFRH